MEKKIIKLTESELIDLVKKVITEEYYDRDKLWNRDYVANRLMTGPRQMRRWAKDLPEYACVDKNGNDAICTKIPEVVFVFLTGRY